MADASLRRQHHRLLAASIVARLNKTKTLGACSLPHRSAVENRTGHVTGHGGHKKQRKKKG